MLALYWDFSDFQSAPFIEAVLFFHAGNDIFQRLISQKIQSADRIFVELPGRFHSECHLAKAQSGIWVSVLQKELSLAY
jgi:hypothetical protein